MQTVASGGLTTGAIAIAALLGTSDSVLLKTLQSFRI
jgi:hypothetical protein